MGILRTNEISGLETPTAVTGSVSFDGDGDYLQVNPGNDFTFGTSSFTIEMFVYKGSGTGTRILYDHRNATGAQGLHPTLYYSGSNLYYFVNGSNILTTSNYTQNTWQHYALVRSTSTNTIKLYINGIEVASASDTNDYVAPQSGAPYIGQNIGGSFYFDGYISNFRILKGTALYTSDFTPPVHELQPIGDTVLLCCNNPDSAAAASYAGIGTSKTITVNGDAVASTFSPGLTRDFTFGTQFEGVAKFDTQGYFVPPSGTTEQRGGTRGLFGGGYQSPAAVNSNTIQYITITTTGNALDFGDLTETSRSNGALSSDTRGLFAGGQIPGFSNTISFITISSTGNAADFGDLIAAVNTPTGCSSRTRGIFGGSYAPGGVRNVLEYITIASTGNTVDFGDLITARNGSAACSSSTRAMWAGGDPPSPGGGETNVIEFITISTLGNAADFGDLTRARRRLAGLSNSTRGVFAGGYDNPVTGSFNIIDYITIAATGNATDFGDISTATTVSGGVSSPVRGVWSGFWPVSTSLNNIEYITILSTGNAIDFGDLNETRGLLAGCSNGHGGL